VTAPASLTSSAKERTPARAYLRAHAGKLMIIERSEDRERSAADFFELEDVGTHPSGLLVTGIFAGARRGHMMASTVRDANAAEIAWRAAQV
jgi:hypothetical protein